MSNSGAECGCYVVYLIFKSVLAYFLSNHFFWMYFDADIAWGWDFLIGMFVGELLLFMDIIGWVLVYLLDFAVPIITM